MKAFAVGMLLVTWLEDGFDRAVALACYAAMLWLAWESCKLVYGMLAAEAKANG